MWFEGSLKWRDLNGVGTVSQWPLLQCECNGNFSGVESKISRVKKYAAKGMKGYWNYARYSPTDDTSPRIIDLDGRHYTACLYNNFKVNFHCSGILYVFEIVYTGFC